MTFERKEIRKVLFLVGLFTGVSLIQDKVKEFVTNTFSVEPWIIGIIILLIFAYLFDITK